MRDVTTSLLKAALWSLHYTRLDAALAPMTQGSGVIFMLHHVLPDEPDAFAPNRILTIRPDFLTFVVEHVLERDFDILSMDEAHARMASGKASKRRFATFTFDDGYRDNIAYALPILRQYSVPMTIYIAPDFCDHRGRAWWLTLEKIIATGTELSVPLPGGRRVFTLTTVQEKYAAYREIYRWLRAMPDAKIHDVVNDRAESAGIDPLAAARELVMDWREIREAAKDPLVTFGAHSMSHAALAKCDADNARFEILGSIEHLEHELGRDCRHFAYPYGDVGSAGPREFAIVRSLGLKTAVTTAKGLVGADARDQLTSLPRLSLNGDFQDARCLQALLTGAPFKMLDLARAALPHRQSQADRAA